MGQGQGSVTVNQRQVPAPVPPPPGTSPNFDYNVETIAALRTDVNNIFLNADPKIVFVQGYYAANDGGGGIFKYDTASVAADDGFITIKPTANTGAGRWIAIFDDKVVNIRRAGAKGDNVTDDKAAIDKALTVNLPVLIPNGDFFSTGGHTINDSQTLFGFGEKSHVRTDTALRFFSIGNLCNVFNIQFEGSGKAAGLPFQTGLFAFGKLQWTIYNCTFINFSGSPSQNGGGGIDVVALGALNQEGGRINNCRFDNNNSPMTLETRGEYIVISNCVSTNNTVGVCSGAGNIYWSNCNFEKNGTAVKLIAGTNVGHGGFVNCSFNHNPIALDCDSQDTGIDFTQCFFYFGLINISNSVRVKFVQCVFDGMAAPGFTLTNNTQIRREHCLIGTNGTGGAIATTLVSGETFTDFDNLYSLGGVNTIINNLVGRALQITGGRFEFPAGANIAAANDLTLGMDGICFIITGNTTINAITVLNWQSGSIISLQFTGTPTVKHNTAGGAGTAKILLMGSVDQAMSANFTLLLKYDGTVWQEVGRKDPNAIPSTASTYLPALTNVANLSASTAFTCQYMRVGNVVTVSGRVTIDPTLAATSTQLGISLPIASIFNAAEQVGGVAFAPGIAAQGAAILADIVNNRAQMQWISTDVTNQDMFFTFTYIILSV